MVLPMAPLTARHANHELLGHACRENVFYPQRSMSPWRPLFAFYDAVQLLPTAGLHGSDRQYSSGDRDDVRPACCGRPVPADAGEWPITSFVSCIMPRIVQNKAGIPHWPHGMPPRPAMRAQAFSTLPFRSA